MHIRCCSGKLKVADINDGVNESGTVVHVLIFAVCTTQNDKVVYRIRLVVNDPGYNFVLGVFRVVAAVLDPFDRPCVIWNVFNRLLARLFLLRGSSSSFLAIRSRGSLFLGPLFVRLLPTAFS